MDSTLGSSFNNTSCNESTFNLLNSTPRCMLFSSISESFNLPVSDSPVEQQLPSKATTSTPSFANDSYSDIIKSRPSKTYTRVEHSTRSEVSPPSSSPSPSPSNLMKPPNRLSVLQPRKESHLVTHSAPSMQSARSATILREVPSNSSCRTFSSSSSVSSLNSDDDTFFEQLTTLQNTLENNLPSRPSPGSKITGSNALLTGEIISQQANSTSNSPLKDPSNQFCVSKAKQNEDVSTGSPCQPLSENNQHRSEEDKPAVRSKEEVGEEKGKENSPRLTASAIRPAQIVPHWGGEGKTASKQTQKRVTFDNKLREENKPTSSKCVNPIPTPTRPQSRFRKIQSAPTLSSPCDPIIDTLNINNKIWCPAACAANPAIPISPSGVQPKRICRGATTPELPASPAIRIVPRTHPSPANTSLNSSISPGEDLLGDNSRTHILPVIKGSNPDLKSIEPETLVRVITGEFSQHIANLVVIDARYPYEYAGGHIKTALNIWTEEMNYQFFLKAPYVSNSDLRHIIVFYCEFSTMRGPNQYRYLRNEDRKLNEASFPKLHYPELYVLNGGYARFFKVASDKCDPSAYIPMLHEDYKEELAKSQQLKLQGSKRASSVSGRVTRPSKSKCRRKQKFN